MSSKLDTTPELIAKLILNCRIASDRCCQLWLNCKSATLFGKKLVGSINIISFSRKEFAVCYVTSDCSSSFTSILFTHNTRVPISIFRFINSGFNQLVNLKCCNLWSLKRCRGIQNHCMYLFPAYGINDTAKWFSLSSTAAHKTIAKTNLMVALIILFATL